MFFFLSVGELIFLRAYHVLLSIATFLFLFSLPPHSFLLHAQLSDNDILQLPLPVCRPLIDWNTTIPVGSAWLPMFLTPYPHCTFTSASGWQNPVVSIITLNLTNGQLLWNRNFSWVEYWSALSTTKEVLLVPSSYTTTTIKESCSTLFAVSTISGKDLWNHTQCVKGNDPTQQSSLTMPIVLVDRNVKDGSDFIVHLVDFFAADNQTERMKVTVLNTAGVLISEMVGALDMSTSGVVNRGRDGYFYITSVVGSTLFQVSEDGIIKLVWSTANHFFAHTAPAYALFTQSAHNLNDWVGLNLTSGKEVWAATYSDNSEFLSMCWPTGCGEVGQAYYEFLTPTDWSLSNRGELLIIGTSVDYDIVAALASYDVSSGNQLYISDYMDNTYPGYCTSYSIDSTFRLSLFDTILSSNSPSLLLWQTRKTFFLFNSTTLQTIYSQDLPSSDSAACPSYVVINAHADYLHWTLNGTTVDAKRGNFSYDNGTNIATNGSFKIKFA